MWLSVDPLSHKAPGWTPYRAFFNNPIKYIDPDGRWEKDANGNWVAEKGDSWWSLHEQSGMSWKGTMSFAKDFNGSRGVDNWKTVRIGDNITIPGTQTSEESSSTSGCETSCGSSGQTNEPNFSFEAGQTYSLNIDAVEIVNVGGVSWGWWEASYGNNQAESGSGLSIGVGGELGLFSRYSVNQITFDKTMSGNSLAGVLNQTGKIELITAGAIIHGVKMKGYTLNTELLWESNWYKGGGWSGGLTPAGSFSTVKFEDK